MTTLSPGGTIGILGGGQLARMLALEARRMGYRVAVLDPQPRGPAAQVADIEIVADFNDLRAASELAEKSDVITVDTDHIPAHVLENLSGIRPVRPSARVVATIQDRLKQREFLEQLGAPQAPWAAVSDLESLNQAAKVAGFPSVMKTRRSGYDGKGQARIANPLDLLNSWDSLARQPAIIESFVDFQQEISVLLARDVAGNVRFHPIAENLHCDHILHTTRVPARIAPELAENARTLGAHIASALGHVGMMAIEFFVTRDGNLLVNEIAPRTHNSGHYTFGACVTSQFEQHLRAICELPLGDTTLMRPVVMLNLLGDLWAGGEPPWNSILERPGVHLHLYGKQHPRPKRKMGHILILDDSADRAAALADTISGQLVSRPS